MHRRQSSVVPSPTVISFPLEEPAPPPAYTPRLAAHLATQAANISSAVSPKLGYTSEYYSGSDRNGALSKLTRWLHFNRRNLVRLALLLLASGLLWRSKAHEHRIVEKAVGRATDHSCRAFPYLARCLSRDPFKSLVYAELRPGELSYPALRTGAAPGEGPPKQPHPIHKLIRDARAEWDAKLAKQSRTLDEAVREYKRRYRQPPPKGFDLWWNWAKENNVQLPDEYDNIYERILPFASLPKILIQERASKLRDDPEFWMREMGFTIRVDPHAKGEKLSADGPMLNVNPRAGEMMKLLTGVEYLIPTELNITLTGHDTPWVVISGESRERHVAAAKANRFVWEKDWNSVDENFDLDGWTAVCPPSSAIRKAGYFEHRKAAAPPTAHPSFIRDHVKAMDVCSHPDNQGLHGFTAWPGPRPGLLYPMFSFTASSLHADLLLPSLEQYDYAVGADVPWAEKKDQVVWRGSTTGSDLTNPHMQEFSQRPRLARLAGAKGQQSVPVSIHDGDHSLGYVNEVRGDVAEMSAKWLDVKFAGPPAQCGSPEMCAKFAEGFTWGDNMPVEEQNKFKYVLDVDGNGWSGRFHRLMASNALVLKSTIFPEWYSSRIQPWVHYIPIKTDYSDLFPILSFFMGSPAPAGGAMGQVWEGEGAHDALAEVMANEGKKWTEEYWRWTDMQSYTIRLLLEYARVMEKDPQDVTNFDYKG